MKDMELSTNCPKCGSSERVREKVLMIDNLNVEHLHHRMNDLRVRVKVILASTG